MRFLVSLLMPKQIGRFFKDSLANVVIYMLFFTALAFIPYAIDTTKKSDIVYTDELVLFQDFKNSQVSTLAIANNELNDTSINEIYYGTNFTIAFNTTQLENSTAMSLVFYKNSYDIYYSKTKLKSVSYTDVNVDFNVADIQQGDFVAINGLLAYINHSYNIVNDSSKIATYASTFLGIALLYIVIVGFLTFAASFFNKVIPVIIRFKIAVYSSTWAFLLYFIGLLTGNGWLFYIGAIISFIFNAVAIRQIVRVNKA